MRTALVTGGAQGIGLAIARRLREEGLRVWIADIAEAGAEIATEDIHALQADVADPGQVEELARKLTNEGGVAVLVNNAGIHGPTVPSTEYPPDEWDAVLRVNLTGPFLCSRVLAPDMIKKGWGRIINVASVAGKIAYPLRSAYATSKWGLIGFTMTLARELGPHGITVNAVCPGPVDNEAMREVFRRRAQATGRDVEAVRQEYLSRQAVARMPTEGDVASMVSYLASDATWAITGQAIDVSCGYG